VVVFHGRVVVSVRMGGRHLFPLGAVPLIAGVPEAGRDASWRVKERLHVAAVAEGGDG